MGINKDRLTEQFVKLVGIDSVSYKEREMADYIRGIFHELGIELHEDDSADVTGGNAGNLHGVFNGKAGKPVLFAAHMDTVEPGIGKKAIVHEDGRITSDGTTVLGADDLAAVAIYMEAVRSIIEDKAEHLPVELLFTVAEEMHTVGASAFDCTRLVSDRAYVLDCSDEIGAYSAQEPTLVSFIIRIHGKAAHAGFEPELGVNAIAAAASAISRTRQGWVNENMNLNIGRISGGRATNIVSEEAVIEGEIRAKVHEDALKEYALLSDTFREEADKAGAAFEEEHKIKLYAYQINEESPALIRYKRALERSGIKPHAKRSFGGCDNNVFKRNGIDGVCLYNPMHKVHSTEEYTTVDELFRMAKIVRELMTKDGD